VTLNRPLSPDDEWCDECGCAHPWTKRFPRQLTARRRRVWPLVQLLYALGRPFYRIGVFFSRLAERVTEWADRPAREAYNKMRGWK
jgi:hypothetical protein